MKALTIIFLFLTHLSLAQDPEEYLNAGYDKYLEEDYKGAILDFNKAAAYNPDNAEIYYLRGVCRSLLGEKNPQSMISIWPLVSILTMQTPIMKKDTFFFLIKMPKKPSRSLIKPWR